LSYCINTVSKSTCYADQIITTVFIPPNKEKRYGEYIFQLILDFCGQIIDSNNSQSVIMAFFPDANKRKQFCDLVDNVLNENSLIAITKSGNQEGEIHIDLQDAFKEFYSFLKKINPIMDSIFQNGKLISEDELLKYCDKIKSDKDLGYTSENMRDAMNNFLSFMGKYAYGNKSIELTVDFFEDGKESQNRPP